MFTLKTLKTKYMRHLIGLFVILAAGAFIVSLKKAGVVSDAQIPYTSVTDQDSYLWTRNTPDGWKWTTSPWTGNDAPYSEARSSIDRLIAGGQDPKNVYMTYRDAAIQNAQDPVDQSGYAYAAWKVRDGLDGEMHMYGVLSNALEALETVRSPLTYQFVRIRFLIEAKLNQMPQLLPLSQRLLEYDASDYDVQYRYVSLLAQFCSPSARVSQVLPLIHKLIYKYPREPNPYWLLGDYYSNACFGPHIFKPENVNDAISAYTEYIQLTPKGYYEIPLVVGMIRGLEAIKENGYKEPMSSRRGG